MPLLPPALAAYMAATVELTMPPRIEVRRGRAHHHDRRHPDIVYPDAYITHGFWALALLLIMKYGARVLSVDCLLRQRHERS